MRKSVFWILAAIMLASCHSDINLKDIDTTSELDLGIVLPVGSIRATIGDFIGGVHNLYVDSVDHKGVITWRDTFFTHNDYHELDMSRFADTMSFSLNLYDKLAAYNLLFNGGRIVGLGRHDTLHFDISFVIDEINKDISEERLDSARIDTALFTAFIHNNNLPIQEQWIDEVSIDLGNRIKRNEHVVTLYKKDPSNPQSLFDRPIEKVIDFFSLVFMDTVLNPKKVTDKPLYQLPKYFGNDCKFRVNFAFTVPAGQEIVIARDAGFDLELSVALKSFSALWGFLAPSSKMRDQQFTDLTESWDAVEFLRAGCLPFTDPQARVRAITQIAGAMRIYGDSLYIIDADGNYHYASFNNSQNKVWTFYQPNQYLDPIESPIGATTRDCDMYIDFNKNPENGRVDKLFEQMPAYIGWGYHLDFDPIETPQLRFVPNTNVYAEVDCKIPLMFNQGLFVSYTDTLYGVNLRQFSIDSLLSQVEMVDTLKATDVTLVLKAQNTIPLCVKASMRCLDENGDIVTDPENPEKPFLLFPQDTIQLAAPYDVNKGGTLPYGETVITASMSKKQLDVLPKVKQLSYTAIIDDSSLAKAYEWNIHNVALRPEQGIRLSIGLTAHVDAIVNLNNITK